MPPRPKFTREDIVSAALDIIREERIEAITAQSVAAKLGTSTRPMFTYFQTVEELRTAAAEMARALYNTYAERGLAMTPPSKGFAMEYIRFAVEEPSLFRLLFLRRTEDDSVSTFLESEGHLETILTATMESFGITHEQALWVYENMWLYAHGLATSCACGAFHLTQEEIAERIGVMCRGLVIMLRVPKDARTGIIPQSGLTMPGRVEDYIAPEPINGGIHHDENS